MIYALDTDHITILQRGGDACAILVSRLRTVAPDDIGTTIVSYEEQCRGHCDTIHRARSGVQRLDAYDFFGRSLVFFSSISVWAFTSEAERYFTALKQARTGVGTNDLKIAAIALSNGATVLTRNARDFSRIPDLLIADWTA